MNKTKIEWCDSTWNPVTGCFHSCPYCYARSMVQRFGTGLLLKQPQIFVIDEPVVMNGKKLPYPTDFVPTFHRYRLGDYLNKKHRTIFVCSMGDLFGKWVPDVWIEEVFEACRKVPQHRYLFLTKNPSRYVELAEQGKLPKLDNMWYGTTITTSDVEYFWAENYHTFLSIEPILSKFEKANPDAGHIEWIVMGAETGNRKNKVVPKKHWIDGIIGLCDEQHIPLFMKESMRSVVGEENMRRDFPWGKI